jgi:hypothetical protein
MWREKPDNAEIQIEKRRNKGGWRACPKYKNGVGSVLERDKDLRR